MKPGHRFIVAPNHNDNRDREPSPNHMGQASKNPEKTGLCIDCE